MDSQVGFVLIILQVYIQKSIELCLCFITVHEPASFSLLISCDIALVTGTVNGVPAINLILQMNFAVTIKHVSFFFLIIWLLSKCNSVNKEMERGASIYRSIHLSVELLICFIFLKNLKILIVQLPFPNLKEKYI